MRTFAQGKKPASRSNQVLPLKREQRQASISDPKVRSLYHLQRIIGNQAVSRMLHGATTIQCQPKQPASGEDKNLKEAGHTVQDPVFSKTADIIDAVLQRNQKLNSYIGDKLKSGLRIGEKGKFVKESSNDNFDAAYRNAYDLHKSDSVPGHVMGFYDPKNAKIHLRPEARFGTALHEAVHKLASPNMYVGIVPMAMKVSAKLGEVLLEGLTAYFTDVILKEEELPPFNSYADLKRKAEQLTTALGSNGFDLMAKLNFKGAALVEIGDKLGLTTKQYADLKTDGAVEVLRRMNKLL